MAEPKVVQEAREKGVQIIHLANDKYGDFYFKKPTKADIKRMFDASTQGNMSTAMEMAIKNAIIYPEKIEFEKLLEDKPGLFIQLFNKLYENVGLGENFSVIEGK